MDPQDTTTETASQSSTSTDQAALDAAAAAGITQASDIAGAPTLDSLNADLLALSARFDALAEKVGRIVATYFRAEM